MILADSSAWVEYLRATGSPAHLELRNRLDDDIAICGAVRMEVLAGARSDQQQQDLSRLLARATTIETLPSDCDTAARIYRACRRGGMTPRSQIDCLIAAVGVRVGVAVLHADRDYEPIARLSPLRVVSLS